MHHPTTTHPARFRAYALALAAALAWTAGGLVPAHAATPATLTAPADAAWASTLTLFQQAAAGDDGAIDEALTKLTTMSAANPGHPGMRAYLGATISLQARASWLPWRKMAYAEDGLAQIDKALSQLAPAHATMLHQGVPVVLETRFVAANTFLKLPALFHRGARGQALLAEVIASPQLATAPLSFRAAVWMRAAAQASEDGQQDKARGWLTQVAQSQAPQADQARARLKELSK